jgi:acetyl esterase
MFQLLFPLVFRFQYSSPDVQFATKRIAKPSRIVIPTRHGDVRALVYSPTATDIEASVASGRRPPVHLIAHGGAFIVRFPQSEDNVARYLASEIGAYIVVPDYDTAPQVHFPVSEQQTYDVFRWVHERAAEMGWDGERVSVGGESAGGKLAINVALQAIDDGWFLPVAVSAEYGCADMSLPDSARTSAKDKPVVAPALMELVRKTYFAGVDPTDVLASPSRHPRLAELPPTLILTGALDTLRHEMHALADDLATRGVEVTRREFPGVDHGFTHAKPVEVAREAIQLIGEHLRRAYGRTLERGERVVSEPPARIARDGPAARTTWGSTGSTGRQTDLPQGVTSEP